MQLKNTKCIKHVDVQKKCNHCNNRCVKNGTAYGKQRYLCNTCKHSFVGHYTYKAYQGNTDRDIKEHVKEGCGIRSIARLLNISSTTVLKRIMQLSKKFTKPVILMGKEYELDELCTYIKRKAQLIWIVYAIRRDTKEVIDFKVGRRTNKTLKHVTDTLILSGAQKIYTDRLQQYRFLLPEEIHCTKQYETNHIERKNLTLRTHLKRLNRRTICFSRSISVLSACLSIYFWG
jgi:insertion element IS1 protein InsB